MEGEGGVWWACGLQGRCCKLRQSSGRSISVGNGSPVWKLSVEVFGCGWLAEAVVDRAGLSGVRIMLMVVITKVDERGFGLS